MIPLEKTLELMLEQLKKDDTLKDRTKWSPKQIVDLLKICLATNFITFEGKIYTQTDGTPIGKSISGPLAGIYVAWLEEMFVKNGRFKAQIIFWRRMKDDVFFVWKVDKNVTPDDFREYLNSIEPRIQFTSEIELNRVLNFADLSIKRLDNKLS